MNVFNTQENEKQQNQYSISNYFLECILRFHSVASTLKTIFILLPLFFLGSIALGIYLPYTFQSTTDQTLYILLFITPLVIDALVLVPGVLLVYPLNLIANVGISVVSFWYLLY